jgi:hypothetical protein
LREFVREEKKEAIMRINTSRNQFIICMLALVSVIVGTTFVLAQGPGVPRERPQPEPLRGLKHALEEAGAPALSTEQESALKTLVSDFRANLPQPDESVRAAHQALDAAILSGNLAAAQAQAAAIANANAVNMTARLRAEAALKIQVLGVLKTNEAQLTALVQRFGESGVARLLGSVLGGPGGFGGPGGPRGPEGFGPGGPGRPGGRGGDGFRGPGGPRVN